VGAVQGFKLRRTSLYIDILIYRMVTSLTAGGVGVTRRVKQHVLQNFTHVYLMSAVVSSARTFCLQLRLHSLCHGQARTVSQSVYYAHTPNRRILPPVPGLISGGNALSSHSQPLTDIGSEPPPKRARHGVRPSSQTNVNLS